MVILIIINDHIFFIVYVNKYEYKYHVLIYEHIIPAVAMFCSAQCRADAPTHIVS